MRNKEREIQNIVLKEEDEIGNIALKEEEICELRFVLGKDTA